MLPVLVAAWLLAGGSPSEMAVPPPPTYVSAEHGLTFRTPPGVFNCRLPADWAGADHGVTLFLKPVSCAVAVGDAEPPKDLAFIAVYYGYALGEDAPPEPPCDKVAVMRLFDTDQPVCRRTDATGVTSYAIETTYRGGDGARDLVLSLTTTPERLQGDLEMLRVLATSLRTCTMSWRNGRKTFTTGAGPACPKTGRY